MYDSNEVEPQIVKCSTVLHDEEKKLSGLEPIFYHTLWEGLEPGENIKLRCVFGNFVRI